MTEILLPIIVIFTTATALLIYKSQDIKRVYKSMVVEALNRLPSAPQSIITEDDIKDLPGPVQKYLVYVGVLGREKVRNYHIVLEAEMRSDPKKNG